MSKADTRFALRLCRELSGFPDVSQRFADAALARLAQEAGPAALVQMEAVLDAGGAAGVAADPKLAPHVKRLLMFLYTGFTEAMGDDDGVPENHFESLMWRAAQAHPPGLSGGYFGHWRYPPEDVDGAA